MNVNYSEELSQAFVVGPDELKKLVELLQKRIGKVSISADCIDKIQREFTTVKDLIDYENPKSKRICRIYLDAREGFEKSATIAFRDSSSSGEGISLSISAREDVVLRLKDKILDVISGMFPWYSPIGQIKLMSPVGFTLYLLAVPLFFILILFLLFKLKLIPNLITREVSSLILLPSIGGIMFLGRLLKWLFPSGIFAIGQGKSRFETLKRVKWGVVISFAVSFAAGCLLLIFK